MSGNESLTPMMNQYFRIKRNYKDALLFFRLGDFYEMFYEDAKIASQVLEIALTSRQKVPMCGVPYHAVNSYLARLLKRGFKVAVCEQVEDPRSARGVVKRDVIKVLTPGTAVEVESGEAKENTYIAAILVRQGRWGLAFIDLASGELAATQGEAANERTLSDELFKAAPREIVYPEGDEESVSAVESESAALPDVLKSPVEAWTFDSSQARNVLLDHFHVHSLEGFDLEDKPLAVSAAGALLYYLKKVRKDSLSLVGKVTYLYPGQFMVLDSTTVKNLELVRNLRDGKTQGSLLGVIDETVTSMGGRLLRQKLLKPLLDPSLIHARLDAVEEMFRRTVERQELREHLKGIADLERLTGKISLAAAHPRDLVSLRKSLEPLPRIRKTLEAFRARLTREIAEAWDDGADIAELISRAILDEPAYLLTEGGIIREGFHAELDDLRRISRSGKSFIAELELKERQRTGIGSLKVRYNRVFGYFIEVTRPNLPLVPPDYIRKQTLVNAERFVTPELKEYEEKILHAEERIGELEERLFSEVREKVARETARLQAISARLAELDVLAALAETASRRNYTRPEVNDGDRIDIQDGRHPVIEVTNDEPFIPNDALLDRDTNQILIVTGPNMGGKSTFLRQVALIVILAQMGSFVPARKATVGCVDRIFTRVGAMDYLSVGQSTFMVEMLETASILNNVTARSLVLLDEVGRGTSTFDGLSIAWAVAEFLHEREEARPKTLFATHYHELTELALTMERIKNYHVAVKEWKGEVVFLRKIVPGPSDRSYGIHVAKLAGIPGSVIDRAREILFNLEKQELDEAGQPVLARRASRLKRRDPSQQLLFPEDREREIADSLLEDIRECDPSALTPPEALEFIRRLKEKLRG